MRCFSLLLAAFALLTAPAAAQEAEAKPAWVGVWQGTIGKLPVIACLDKRYNSGGIGSYYYRKHLKPIGLWLYDDSPDWVEHPPGENKTARWTFNSVGADTITGTWSDGKRRLPIRLTALAWQDAETAYIPCEALAFISPRLAGGEVIQEAAETDGIAYVSHRYRNPPQLDVSANGFSLIVDQPGDAAINAAVANYIPTGTLADDWVECLSGAMSHLGGDGYFDRDVRPEMISDAFIAISIAGSTYCGGAHPNHVGFHRLFDRQSGEEIELDEWFADAAFQTDEYDTRPMTEGFRDHVLAFADAVGSEADYDAECLALARTQGYWNLQLTRDGVTFTPDLPHVATACENPISLPWSALDDWLSDAGRAGKARLLASD